MDRKKLEYFWDYYKWWVLIPLIVILILGSLVKSFREETKPVALYVVMIDSSMDEDTASDMADAYAKSRGIDVQETPIQIDTGISYPKSEDTAALADTATVAGIQRYQALISTGTADVILSPPWVVEEHASDQAYVNLAELLPADLQELAEPYYCYYTNESGESIPLGLDLESFEQIKEVYEDVTPVLSVSAYSTRQEESIAFIRWILESE
jgi:hypothetical protein